VSVGGLSFSGGLHAVVIVIKRQLSLTAMPNDCTEFMHLQPHTQMPDDDTTIDYRYDLLDRISVYNEDYVSKTSVCINYMRSHLITADAVSAYIIISMCNPRVFLSDPAKYTAIGGLHPVETLPGHRRSAMVCIYIHFMIMFNVKMCNGSHAAFDKLTLGKFSRSHPALKKFHLETNSSARESIVQTD